MLYYCGFDSFLQFKQKTGKHNVFLQPLSDLVLDRDDKVINAFIGWCSLFLQTGKGQVLYLGYSKCKSANEKTTHIEKNNVVVCSEVPKYICSIECGPKSQTFLITLDRIIYNWSGFNFAKSFPTRILLNTTNDSGDDNNGSASRKHDEEELSQLKVEQLSIGGEYSCLLSDQGKAYLFDITKGQLGNLLSDHAIVSCSAGQEHILLLTENGQVLSYGCGSRGQLGHGNLENIDGDALARPIEALEGIKCKAIAAGGWHSLALTECGTVYSWGSNDSGQLGIKKEISVKALPIPLEISDDDTFMTISAGSRHSMAVSENGILFGFGWNRFGQLGLDSKEVPFCDSPQVINLDEKVSNIVCKYWSSLVETERENGL